VRPLPGVTPTLPDGPDLATLGGGGTVLGTDFVLRSLVTDGVTHLFLVPGGLVDPFLPALGRVPELTPIVAAHEGGAAFMADGYARSRGHFGACLVIGGPGLTNATTALSAAFTDEVPVLALSGEVASFLEGLGFFQDASAATYDDAAIVSTITNVSYSVPDVRLLHHRYRDALERMHDHVAGPAHLGLPREVQTGEVAIDPEGVHRDLLAGRPFDERAAAEIWRRVGLDRPDGAVRRIVLLTGVEVNRDDEAASSLRAVAELFHLPVATTQHAKGVLPEDHELSLGVFGYAGSRWSNVALLEDPPDLAIVLGSVSNQRDTLSWTSRFEPRDGLIAVAPSPRNVSWGWNDVHYVQGQPARFLEWLLADGGGADGLLEGVESRRAWLEEIRSTSRYMDEQNLTSDQVPIHPARLVAECNRVMPRNTIALPDSGAHRAFLVHYWQSFGPRQFITAANLGPMGWGIGAAIGAQAARPDDPVLLFTGDGCMQMHGIEIQTAARYNLGVTFVVDNNAALGNVWLRAHEEGPVPAELTRTIDHDWAAFAQALGVEATTVREPDEIAPALERALETDGPFLLDVKTERDAPTPVEPFAQAKAHWSYHE
jgi:acetolactate synthase-1/2/3 large subunit